MAAWNKNSRGDLENELFDGYVTDAVSDDEEDKEWQSENINQIFNTCDFDRCGYLDKDKLQRICPHLNSNEIDLIFSNLDTNKDNKISLSEFSRGFKALLSEYVSNEFSAKTSSLNHKYSSSLPSMSVTNEYSRLFSNDKQDVHSQVNEVLDDLACQEQVFEFYDILRNGDAAESVEQFRNILEIFVRDISKYQQETKRLEEAYKREKENHDKYLKHIEEDYEREMRLLEENTRQEEKEKFDQEREYLRQKSAKEISDLQSMIQRMQTIEERYTEMKTGEDSAMLSLRNEILKLTQENQTLNSSLNESITSIAILKSDLSAMKGHLNDRQNLLLHEKQSSSNNYREKESMKTQVQLLVEVNKKLRDDNDSLRASIESVKWSSSRAPSENLSPSVRNLISRSGSCIDKYWNNKSTINGLPAQQPLMLHPSHLAMNTNIKSFDDAADSDDLGRIQPLNTPISTANDSGFTTFRDTEVDSDREQQSQSSEPLKEAPNTLTDSKNSLAPTKKDNGTDSDDVFDDDRASSPGKWKHRWTKLGLAAKKTMKTQTFPFSLPQFTSTTQTTPDQPELLLERMYRIVFCGDTAVGKSTLLMRICKGKFISNMNSTLGVDVQIKQLEIDGTRAALQLWDTAGQERFRSVAKSYFRRCDGVFLVYDCTYERSFLNVREWINMISEVTTKTVSVMIVGNKIDLRDEARSEGRTVVEYEDGMRLMKEYGVLFIETSAKDGTNSDEALLELARDMRCNEDIQVISSGIKLAQDNPKSTCCS